MHLQAGTYTMSIYGKNETTGIAVASLFNQSLNNDARIIAFAGRMDADGQGENMGIIVWKSVGECSAAITAYSHTIQDAMPGAKVLADPYFRIHDPNDGYAIEIENDNWGDNSSSIITELALLGLTPSNTSESAIIHNFAEGEYHAYIHGKGSDTQGNVLVTVDIIE